MKCYWGKNKNPAVHSRQFSDWIDINDDRQQFEFLFRLAAGTMPWLLCLRQRVGFNNETIETLYADGMQIIDVGTCDKKDLAILNKRIATEDTKQPAPVKNVEGEPVRVKATRMV